jgi:hypothetical protein
MAADKQENLSTVNQLQNWKERMKQQIIVAASAVCIGAGMWLTAAPAQAAPCVLHVGVADPVCAACFNAAFNNPQGQLACFGQASPPAPAGPDPLCQAGARLTGIPC